MDHSTVSLHQRIWFPLVLKHDLNYDSHYEVNYSNSFPLLRPSPDSSDAPANLSSHRHGWHGQVSSGSSASSAPCGLDEGWRTTWPVLGNQNKSWWGLSHHNTSWPLLFAQTLIFIARVVKGQNYSIYWFFIVQKPQGAGSWIHSFSFRSEMSDTSDYRHLWHISRQQPVMQKLF